MSTKLASEAPYTPALFLKLFWIDRGWVSINFKFQGLVLKVLWILNSWWTQKIIEGVRNNGRAEKRTSALGKYNSQRCLAVLESHVPLHSANPFNRKILCEKIRVPDRHFASTPPRPLCPDSTVNIWQTTTLISNLIPCQMKQSSLASNNDCS